MTQDAALLVLQGLVWLFLLAGISMAGFLVYFEFLNYRARKRDREGVQRMLKYVEERTGRDAK